MGCNMTSFLLHESIYYAKENNSYMFASSTPSIDKKWLEGLFIKPFKMGIELYLWKIIANLHMNLSSCVLFRGFKS